MVRKREPQARRLCAPRGARYRPRGALRRRRRPDRRLRALLVVHRGNRDVSGRDLDDSERRSPGCRSARCRAPSGDGLSRRAGGRGDRGDADRPPLRGAGLRPLPGAREAGGELKARLSTDGGSRGNPGPAAYGYVLEADDGTVLDARGETIGVATNNVAEYSALKAGLESALERGVVEIEVVSDSELLVKQMRGEYKVKNEALRELVEEAEALARRLGKVTYTAVRREHNELADRLVNEALDSAA